MTTEDFRPPEAMRDAAMQKTPELEKGLRIHTRRQRGNMRAPPDNFRDLGQGQGRLRYFGAHKLDRDAGRNEHAKKPYYKPHRSARRGALMVLRQAHHAKASQPGGKLAFSRRQVHFPLPPLRSSVSLSANSGATRLSNRIP